MPSAPARFCLEPRCPARAVQAGRCTGHQQSKRQEQTRYQHGNYGRPWRRIRQAFIDSDPEHVWCAECLKDGTKTVMDEVDHIIPHRGDVRLRDDPNNMQSLCKTHHSRKTASETGFVIDRGVSKSLAR